MYKPSTLPTDAKGEKRGLNQMMLEVVSEKVIKDKGGKSVYKSANASAEINYLASAENHRMKSHQEEASEDS